MTVRTFLIGSFLALIAGGGAWALVITQLDPDQAGASGFVLFFLSLFVALTSLTSLVGYGVRRLIMRRLAPVYAVRTSLRQGGLISIFASVILMLQLLRLYRWWIAIVALALVVFLELLFLSHDRAGARARVKPESAYPSG